MNRLLDSLFPRNIITLEAPKFPPIDQEEVMEVNIIEVIRLIKKRPTRNAALGPDNIKALAWRRAPRSTLGHIASILTACLKEGVFLERWKKAILVLIPKVPGGGVSGEIKACPICLLDELGKTLERVIANRINDWLENNEQFSLSSNQYGFQKNRRSIHGRCSSSGTDIHSLS